MKTYVWSLTSRLLHWILAFAFVGAFILGENDSYRSLHITFGIVVFSAVIFRFIWGIIGPKYSKFIDFPISPKSLINHFKNIFNKDVVHVGHNPLASVVMLIIYFLGLLSAVSGMAILAKDGQGFMFLAGLPGTEDFFEEFHEIVTKLFLVSVILHLLGLMADKILYAKQGAIFSMITGYKNIEAESIKLNLFQKIISVIAISSLIGIFGYYFTNPVTINEKNGGKEKLEKENEHENDHEPKGHDD